MPRALTRWEPFTELAEMRSRFDRAFDDMVGGHERTWTPTIDVERDSGNLVVRANVPGFKPEDVRIEIEDDVLTLHGEHEEQKDEEGKHFVRRERHYGSFSRSMSLPTGVDAKNVNAVTHDGVLEVTIPLPKETAKKAVTITPTAA